MKTQTFIASAVLLVLQGCATAPEEKPASVETDLSQSLPPPAAGLPASPLYYASAKEAEKALVGYNYALTNQSDGSVQAFVTGVVGSGANNLVTQNQSTASAHTSLIAELGAEGSESPFPNVSLSAKKNGQAAIDALGDKLDEVAQSYGMSPERLEQILRTDSTAWIDQTGHLFYIDSEQATPEQPPQETATLTIDSGNITTLVSSTDAFTLHSKPGASRLIYLDFNGHVASNTAWYAGSLNAQAYDIDSNPGVFSTLELNNIKEIWQRVAEDFASFDVDVTTQEPAEDLLQRTSSADSQYGTRAVITHSMPELCSQSCGGVAYVNSYSYYSSAIPDAYKPAWVFSDKLGNGYPKYVAEAASHEIGHNLNLNHDGNSATSYYAGHGSGATGWASIMGVGYYKPVTQWNKGEYVGSNNFQDDIAVIQSAGASLRADDYANNITEASLLGGAASAISQAGIIERNTDVDIFAFTAGSGLAQITVTPDSVSPNLDVLLKVLDAQGNTVAQANPADNLSASLSVSLLSGQYFLQIEGVGAGDLTTGYSNYGSLGQYQITGSFAIANKTSVSPVAVISALPVSGDAPLGVQLNGIDSSDSDGSIETYHWNFGDGGTASGGPSANHIYQTAGTYTTTLTVTDNNGLKSSATQNIVVTQSPVTTSMRVTSTNLTRKMTGGKPQCLANVTLKYAGSPVKAAKIYGKWSGSVTVGTRTIWFKGIGSATTNNKGVASFLTPTVPKASKGTCAFSVTNATKTGYTYEGNGTIDGSYTW